MVSDVNFCFREPFGSINYLQSFIIKTLFNCLSFRNIIFHIVLTVLNKKMSLIFIKRNWNVGSFYLDQFVDQTFGVADQNDRQTKTIYSTFDGIEMLKNTSNTSGLTSESK